MLKSLDIVSYLDFIFQPTNERVCLSNFGYECNIPCLPVRTRPVGVLCAPAYHHILTTQIFDLTHSHVKFRRVTHNFLKILFKLLVCSGVMCKQKFVCVHHLCTSVQYSKEGGYIGNLLHYSPKFYNIVFLFVGLTTLGTLFYFDWLVH